MAYVMSLSRQVQPIVLTILGERNLNFIFLLRLNLCLSGSVGSKMFKSHEVSEGYEKTQNLVEN